MQRKGKKSDIPESDQHPGAPINVRDLPPVDSLSSSPQTGNLIANLKFFAFISVLIGLGVLFFLYAPWRDTSTPIQKLYSSYERLATRSRRPYKHVAIGYNTCLDLIVNGKDAMLDFANETGSVATTSQRSLNITRMEDLVDLYKYAFENGVAVERFISNETLCKHILDKAIYLPDRVYNIGGNAGLMAVRFLQEGADVLLAGAMGPLTREKIPRELKVVNSQHNTDEIHLIMEFKRNEKWGSLQAPRDNRVIVHCDKTNTRLDVQEDFFKTIGAKQYIPDLVVISGLHLLEGAEPEFRTEKLQEVGKHIVHLNTFIRYVPIHLELASTSNSTFMQEISEVVLPRVNSVGLNEQELGFLYYSMAFNHNLTEFARIQTEFSNPNVSTIIEAMKFILLKIYTHVAGSNTLHRIHLHSLKYHAIAQTIGPQWAYAEPSIAAGIYAAATQACEFDTKNDDAEEKFMVMWNDDIWGPSEEIPARNSLDPAKPVYHWIDRKNNLEFFVAPMLICKRPTKTVGLGDAISAMALSRHPFKH